MLKKIKQLIKDFYYKRGFKFKGDEKYVVIESDDWGSIRSTKEGVDYLKKNYPNFKLDAYQEYDCLETLDDIKDLCEVLKKHKDKNGRHPVVTANFIMNNIDCSRAKAGEVSLIPFYECYNKNNNVVDFVIKNKDLFYPQLHGNVHLNISQLIEESKTNPIVKELLDYNTIGVCLGSFNGMDTFSNKDKSLCSVEESAKIFEQTFGYKSKTAIFPCYTWQTEDEKQMLENGITCLQGNTMQWIPSENKTKLKLRFMGQKNKFGQTYLTRNCHFEPSKYRNKGENIELCLDLCFNQIEKAFKNKKPAIICSHRCNFVKSISVDNQRDNLLLLDKLLNKILETYPDCKFVTSEELYKIITNKK